ncbi:alginate O-acetyltransferase AlgX-related protein [Intestinimonas timonensis]|uniref:alginate O-acetyltransferase AlgX-related protein n=1 Tax=Intestinimonas timonensis TaxID=1689270 RepID=UPI003A8ECB8D
MKRISEVCFSILFVGILFAVPLLILFHGSKIQALYYENRALSSVPEANAEDLLSGDYFSQWDSWLTDHVAGRERLLKLNTWLDYRLLDRPAVNGIVEGEGGILFPFQAYGTWDLDYLSEDAAAVCDSLARLDQLVSSYGGRFYYVGLPLQNAFYYDRYPDYLENRYWHISAMTEAFAGAMEERGLAFLDMEPVLRAAQTDNQPLYAASDHHFNYYGAYLTYRSVMERITADLGRDLPVLTADDLTFQALENPFLGSRNRKLYGLWPGSEPLTIGVQREPVAFDRTDNGLSVTAQLFRLPATPTETVDYNVYMGGDVAETVLSTHRPELPDLLIFGDSFTNPLETLFYTGFDETRSLDLRYADLSLLDYVAEHHPDVVLCIRDDTSYLSTEGNGNIH